MDPAKPPLTLDLIWEHDLVLSGRARDARMTLDSDGVEGPSPVQALAFALAGCMAMDVVHVIRKGRHDLRGLRVELKAHRAPENPKHLTDVSLEFSITGVMPDAVVARAIKLSHDKYCSVWHSLRQDITLSTRFTVTSGV